MDVASATKNVTTSAAIGQAMMNGRVCSWMNKSWLPVDAWWAHRVTGPPVSQRPSQATINPDSKPPPPSATVTARPRCRATIAATAPHNRPAPSVTKKYVASAPAKAFV